MILWSQYPHRLLRSSEYALTQIFFLHLFLRIVRPSATSCSDLLPLLRPYISYNASSMVASSGNSSMACWIRFLSMVSSIMAFLGFNILQCRYLTIRNKIKFVPMSLWAYQPYHITSAKTSRAHRCPGNHADTHTRLG